MNNNTMKSQKHLPYLLLLVMVALVSCTSIRSEDAGLTSSSTYTFSCEVFYRSSAGGPLEAAPVNPLTKDNGQQMTEFGDLAFEANYQIDQFKGQVLYISVVDLDTGAELSRQLYQFDSQNRIENQFIGVHGFTGLHYVYHPNSPAEMQYFCSVQ